jgi:hypothetical protein
VASTDRRYGLSGGVAFKAPCRVATTANITLNGLQTVDGVSLAQDDRVLVKNQSTASQNGIWIADSGDWTRALDFNGARDVVQGTLVLVVSGTVNASTVYQLTTASPVIGSTSLTFAVTGTPALFYASAFIQTLLDDATAADARATLGVPAIADAIPATLTTAGDILSHNGSTYVRLPRGTASQYLGVSGTAVTWKDLIIDLTSQVTGVLPVANGGFGEPNGYAARTASGATLSSSFSSPMTISEGTELFSTSYTASASGRTVIIEADVASVSGQNSSASIGIFIDGATNAVAQAVMTFANTATHAGPGRCVYFYTASAGATEIAVRMAGSVTIGAQTLVIREIAP